jgi:hypothetical protein
MCLQTQISATFGKYESAAFQRYRFPLQPWEPGCRAYWGHVVLLFCLQGAAGELALKSYTCEKFSDREVRGLLYMLISLIRG